MIKKPWAKRQIRTPISKSSDAVKAYKACLRQLTRQDRSRFELEKKLSQWYTPNAVDFAVQKAADMGYLKSETELASRHTDSQRLRGRGRYRIQQELKKRGLPVPPVDRDAELASCQFAFSKKFGDNRPTSHEERARASRYLASRGFDLETIKRVIYEKQ